jgi:hypothetical protein
VGKSFDPHLRQVMDREWLIRGLAIVIGLSFAVVSLVGILQGVSRVPWFNHTRGEQGIMPLGMMFLSGALLTAIGMASRDSQENAERHTLIMWNELKPS